MGTAYTWDWVVRCTNNCFLNGVSHGSSKNNKRYNIDNLTHSYNENSNNNFNDNNICNWFVLIDIFLHADSITNHNKLCDNESFKSVYKWK